MRVVTVGLTALPFILASLGFAAAAVISGQTPLSSSPDPAPRTESRTTDGEADQTAIEGRRPFLTVIPGPEPPFAPPGSAVGMFTPLLDPAPETAPVIPAAEATAIPVTGAAPHLDRTVVTPSPPAQVGAPRPVPVPVQPGPGPATPTIDRSTPPAPPTDTSVTDPGTGVEPEPAPVGRPPVPVVTEPTETGNDQGDDDQGGPGDQGAADEQRRAVGRPDHATETGRPDHADTTGRPDHSYLPR